MTWNYIQDEEVEKDKVHFTATPRCTHIEIGLMMRNSERSFIKLTKREFRIMNAFISKWEFAGKLPRYEDFKHLPPNVRTVIRDWLGFRAAGKP